jgi:hypothetical protein
MAPPLPVAVYAASVYVPAHRPPVTGVVGGRDGSTWLRRENSRPDSVTWQVLDARGNVHGELVLPTSLTIFDATLTRIWGVSVDRDGVNEVVRFRLRVSGESPPRFP